MLLFRENLVNPAKTAIQADPASRVKLDYPEFLAPRDHRGQRVRKET